MAATDPRWEGVGGKFIVDGKERRSSDESYDEAKARRLWDLSWRGAVWMEAPRLDRVPDFTLLDVPNDSVQNPYLLAVSSTAF